MEYRKLKSMLAVEFKPDEIRVFTFYINFTQRFIVKEGTYFEALSYFEQFACGDTIRSRDFEYDIREHEVAIFISKEGEKYVSKRD